jgi:hypothetical protein
MINGAYEMGRRHALERGPKTQAGIETIQSLNEVEYLDYLRGVKSGLNEIVSNAAGIRKQKIIPAISEEEIHADLHYPNEIIHTEFIGEDND